jgi:hypothetical protein
MDAWLKPPAYTGKPPGAADEPRDGGAAQDRARHSVPDKAVLSLRITGAKAPKLSFHELPSKAPTRLKSRASRPRSRPGMACSSPKR